MASIDTGKKTRVPSITDPNSGFKLMSTTKDKDLAEISSLYSEPCYDDTIVISGTVKLGLWYNDEEHIFYVRVAKAKGLATIPGEDTNPYANIHFLTDDSKPIKRKTGIQKKTTNPKFDEIIKYKLSREDLTEVTLLLSMWSWDVMGRNKFLGEVKLPLSSRDLDLSDSKDKIYTLKDHEETDVSSPVPHGKLFIAIMFEPISQHRHSLQLPTSSSQLGNSKQLRAHSLTTELTQVPTASSNEKSSSKDVDLTLGKLHILIKYAENLFSMNIPDPFVRCYLLPNTSFGGKRKTSISRGTLDPVWEEKIVYNNVEVTELRTKRVLEVTVWDQDRRGNNSFIGGLRLGPTPQAADKAPDWMDSVGDEVSQWEEMLDNVGKWVESWHDLRPSMNSLYAPRVAKNLQITQESDIDPSHQDTLLAPGKVELEGNQWKSSDELKSSNELPGKGSSPEAQLTPKPPDSKDKADHHKLKIPPMSRGKQPKSSTPKTKSQAKKPPATAKPRCSIQIVSASTRPSIASSSQATASPKTGMRAETMQKH